VREARGLHHHRGLLPWYDAIDRRCEIGRSMPRSTSNRARITFELGYTRKRPKRRSSKCARASSRVTLVLPQRQRTVVPRVVAPAVGGTSESPRVQPSPAAASSTGTTGGIEARAWVLIGGGALTATALGAALVYQHGSNSAADNVQRASENVEREFVAGGGDPALLERKAVCGPASPMPPRGAVSGGVVGLATAITYFVWPQTASRTETPATLTSWSHGSARGLQIRMQF
jgi:hypothetical protein